MHAETLTDDEVYDVLLDNGFNGLGAWSDESILTSSSQQNEPLAYVPKFSFLGEYEGRSANLNFPVFDDEWPIHAENYAIEVATQYKDAPNVFGFFSDYEIRWRTNLQEHLDLNDPSNKNYTTAMDFLASRGKTPTTWEEEDENVYLGMMADAYYSAVAAGLKKAAPNHMFLGSRNNSSERNAQEFMEAAGRHVDVFSMNHYSRWGSRDVTIHNYSNWTVHPLMVTEYFAKESVTGQEAGSGYQVIDQESRGLFYQN